ncbi:hypothetical protein [Streptomyces xiamenensis]|uniref:hypothetical protein n=1 Tax=Streptomyces xiamenensis TaxID=408015 RepID=UPI003D75C450
MSADAVTGPSVTFPRKAKATFTYADSNNSEVSEELYSDSASTPSDGIGRIFDAMIGCPAYQVVSGSPTIGMASPRLKDPTSSVTSTASVLVSSRIQQSPVPRGTQPAGDRV